MTKSGKEKIKVAFQGNRGAFSEAAAIKYFNNDVDLKPLHSFDDVFEKVASMEVNSGVLPIENSLTGPIHRNYDLLLKNDLWIVGETQIRIRHNLIAHPGTKIEDLKQIYSHPQGLAQCEKFLSKYPGIENLPAYDTAGSVQMIKEKKLLNAAAIASNRAAEFYGMEIIAEGIEDCDENYTRFIVLKKNHTIAKDADKTSIVFSMKNTPGSLFKCLSVFALRDISLSKIESRPLYGKPWQYFFYLDLEDNVENEKCKNAIKHLQEIADFFKILGCYRKGLN